VVVVVESCVYVYVYVKVHGLPSKQKPT
jgi:hypothetical protein